MYSLDINFLKNRREYQNQSPTGIKTSATQVQLENLVPVYIGLGLGLVLPALVFTGLSILQGKNAQLTQEIGKLEEEGKTLDGTIANIIKLKAEVNSISNQNKALVTVFDQIRPWSVILQDLRDRIPRQVQIETIKQVPGLPPGKDPAPTASAPNSAGFLEISGYAMSYGFVNDFALSLGQSQFLNPLEAKIVTAELIDAPPITGFVPPQAKTTNVTIKPLQVVKYTIKIGLSSVPASDLIPELEKKGTVGLVDRLRNMRKVGVIAQ